MSPLPLGGGLAGIGLGVLVGGALGALLGVGDLDAWRWSFASVGLFAGFGLAVYAVHGGPHAAR